MRKRFQTGFHILLLLICVVALSATVVLFMQLDQSHARSHLLLLLCVALDILLIVYYFLYIHNRNSTHNHALHYEHLAYTDAMTQVHNRAAFDLMAQQLTHAHFPRLTLIMADLNNLKQVNDTLGHPAGDRLISSLVRCLKESFGHLGEIYRYGGDEFIVLIKHAPIEDVQAARVNFDKMILDHTMHGGLEIFVALGIASRQDPHSSNLHVMELLNAADDAMYRFKASQKAARSTYQPARHQWLENIDAPTGILTFPAFKSRIYSVLSSDMLDAPCIVSFDLNFFDGYNNLFGWEAGNQLLQRMTTLALGLCGRKGFCAHGEADSFWVFADHTDVSALITRIEQETARFQEQLGDLLLFLSFGIYPITDRMTPVSDMCGRASSAKRSIKGHLDVLYKVYSDTDRQRRIDNMRLTSYMQRGLSGDEFVPYFQPKFSADGSRIVGAEALVRWLQENDACLTPREFMTLYESSGLILSVDWHILEKVCAFLREQLDAKRPCVPISVNFSRLHVYEEDCAQRISRLADQYSLPHSLVEIELTETALTAKLEKLPTLVASIREQGFSVSLDGFGSGLSSLGLLKRLTVDAVKIDRSLMAASGSAETDHAVLSGIADMCRNLHIATVAEGIETQEQLERMRQCGCTMLQGQYLAPVMPAAEFQRMLSEN